MMAILIGHQHDIIQLQLATMTQLGLGLTTIVNLYLFLRIMNPGFHRRWETEPQPVNLIHC